MYYHVMNYQTGFEMGFNFSWVPRGKMKYQAENVQTPTYMYAHIIFNCLSVRTCMGILKKYQQDI